MLAINFDNEIVLTNVYEGFNNYFIIYFPDVYLPTYLLYLFCFYFFKDICIIYVVILRCIIIIVIFTF